MRSGEVDALLTIWMVAVRVPDTVGENETERVQWALTLRLDPQPLVRT